MIKAKKLPEQLNADTAKEYQGLLKGLTTFIPTWVKIRRGPGVGLGHYGGLEAHRGDGR